VKQSFVSIVAVCLLFIGIITSLSSFSNKLSVFSTNPTTTGTGTTNPTNNGTAMSGVPCSYINYVYSERGELMGREIYSGLGTVCALGGSDCYTEQPRTNISCIATAKVFIPGSN
jgi:hypothetical protein